MLLAAISNNKTSRTLNVMEAQSQLISSNSKINLALIAWLAMFASILIWGFGAGDDQPGTLGNSGNWYRIGLVLFSGGASVWALLRNASRLNQALSAPLVLLSFYAVIAIISSLYVPTYALYTMWKGLEILVDVLVMAAILGSRVPLNYIRTAYRIILVSFTILIVIYLVEAIAMPSKALVASRGYLPIQLHGVLPMMPENGLAFLSAVVVYAIFCRLFRHGKVGVKILYLVFMGLAFISLILAQSRTSVIGLAVAMVVYLFFDRRYGFFAVMALASFVLVLFTQSSEVTLEFLRRGQDEQLMTSLSGRTAGWSVAWKLFLQDPVLGYGFAAYARANILGIGGASSMHGAIFDVMVGVGLLGLIPWAFAILTTSFRLLRLNFSRHPWFQTRSGRNMQAEMSGLLMITIVRMTTNSGMSLHSHEFMIFLVILAYVYAILRATISQTAKETKILQVDRNVSTKVHG